MCCCYIPLSQEGLSFSRLRNPYGQRMATYPVKGWAIPHREFDFCWILGEESANHFTLWCLSNHSWSLDWLWFVPAKETMVYFKMAWMMDWLASPEVCHEIIRPWVWENFRIFQCPCVTGWVWGFFWTFRRRNDHFLKWRTAASACGGNNRMVHSFGSGSEVVSGTWCGDSYSSWCTRNHMTLVWRWRIDLRMGLLAKCIVFWGLHVWFQPVSWSNGWFTLSGVESEVVSGTWCDGSYLSRCGKSHGTCVEVMNRSSDGFAAKMHSALKL